MALVRGLKSASEVALRRSAYFGSIPLLALLIACGGEERETRDRQTAPPAEPARVGEAADQTVEATESGEPARPAKTTVDEPSDREEAAGAATGAEQPEFVGVPAGPRRVAPAAEGDESGMKNWLLIEFARPIEAPDLEWLEQHGFRVDSVMSATTVRGWLEDAAGGAVIGRDPRIARIDAQMR